MPGQGPGRTIAAAKLFAVVGASGAGKDTLLAAAKRQRPDLCFLRRVITRPATAGGESFESVSAAEFARRQARGEFALSWTAHGLHYAIPASVHRILAAGQSAVFNGSRTVLTEANAIFPRLVVIHVTASSQVLAQRLSTRGREQAEEVAQRLARADMPLPGGLRDVIRIDNSGSLPDALAAFMAALSAAPG